MEGDAEYFRRRALQEREAAMKASHPSAREAHGVIADRYTEFANAIERHEFAWGIGETDDPLVGRDYRIGQRDGLASRR